MSSSNSSSVVAGWEADRVVPTQGRVTLAEALVEGLQGLGVRTVFGIVGGGIAPFADAVARSSLSLVHTRHEAGATFGATEAFFATGAPSAAFVTTGPGLTNAITGVMAARWDGAKVVLLSGYTSSAQRGRFGVQETTASTMPAGLLAAGPVFDYANTLSDLRELPQVLSRLAHGFARPQGFVAHLALPLELQGCSLIAPRLPPVRTVAPCRAPQAVVDLLAHGRTPIWIGYGARGAETSIRALAERTGAAVMSSPRAKGVFPETHPQYLGVTGVGGHDNVARYLEVARPDHVLVLGSRLGEVTSIWDPRLCPRRAFIHVDVDGSVFGASYGAVETLGVQAEIGSFVDALLEQLPDRAPRSVDLPACPPPPRLELRATGPVRPRALLAAVQRVVVEGSDALVMSESGNAFGWANHLLRFEAPRYRTSAAFGSMGHFVTGVVGSAIARAGKAVALVGDGAMLMNNEISTAVRYDAQAVWVVLNDARYGITDQAMKAQGFEPVETLLPSTDFVAFARSMGADGVVVEHEDELEGALARAMRHEGPFVVDVRIDPTEINPVLASRVASLERQSTNPEKETK